MAKKKKHPPSTGKKSKHRFSNAQREAPVEKPSVFEARSGRLKFDVLGKKTRGVRGDALKARTAGVTKRRNTLLKEHQGLGSANVFSDRRFGEGDVDMTPEERSIGRLARARLRQLRPGKSFALNEDDDDGNGGGSFHDVDDAKKASSSITHGGAPIDPKKEERRSAHYLARGATRRRGDESDSDDDRDGGGIGRDATAAMHFGGGGGGDDDDDEHSGGFSLKRSDHESDLPERRKTKKEVMEELIAKSKHGKATRARQREADETALDKLDDEFRLISDSGVLSKVLAKGVGHLKPDGWEKGSSRKQSRDDKLGKNGTKFGFQELEAVTLARTATNHAGDVVKDDYDKLTRELGLEARGQAVDRTKTAEEIEAAEAAELESAERNRLKRARGDDDDSDGGDDTHGKPGGFAARRAKAKQADAKLAKREARGADGGDDDSDASDDDLRDAKSGKRKSGDELEDGRFDLDSSEEDGSGDDASGSDSGFDSDEYDNDQDLDQDETAALKKNVKGMRPDLEAGKARLRKLGILKDGGPEEVEVEEEEEEAEEGEEEEEAEESEEDEAAPAPSVPLQEKSTKEKKIEAPKKSNTTPVTVETLPFVFAMPETTTGLDEITKGLSPAETRTVLDRVRKLHAPSLKPENRKLTQNFLGLLLRKFETLAGEIPLPVPYMDAVVAVIIPVAGTVPFFAATAARTRVEKMANRLRKSLRDGETGWPPARTFLLLALFAEIFPTTDKQHPVTTPAALFIGNVLAHCAVRSRKEAVAAVFAGALAGAYSSEAGRIFPEAVVLLTGLIYAASGQPNCRHGLSSHLQEQVGGCWLGLGDVDAKTGESVVGEKKKGTTKQSDALPLSLPAMLASFGSASGSTHDPDWLLNGDADRESALVAALSTLRLLVKPVFATVSAVEILSPVRIAVTRLVTSLGTTTEKKSSKKQAGSEPNSSPNVTAACAALLVDIDAALAAGAKRTPLRWRVKSTEQIKQFNPMYEEEGYQKGRDYDPNRERAEKKRLTREVKQEARGAVRELRKDNKFLAEQRNAEASVAKEERGEKQKETLAFLEKMEGDLKSGGQGGVIVKTTRRVNGGGNFKGKDRKKKFGK